MPALSTPAAEHVMNYSINPNLEHVAFPPIAEAHGWVDERPVDTRTLLDVAQAVPSYPPPATLRAHLAAAMERPELHQYTDILGFPELRSELARHLGICYEATVPTDHTGIVSGCNQAFCLATAAVAREGDEVILPLPYYFNHQMWLEAQGIRPVYLPAEATRAGIPDPAAAADLLTARTRAIVLVTPNNPTGAVYPSDVIEHFFELAQTHGIALIVDETYKDFLGHTERPHDLFRRPDWPRTLIQLYSFSKAYSLTGHRVGSITAAPELIEHVMKAADCLAICPPAIGQEAALYGLRELADWRESNRRLMADRVAALREAFRTDGLRYELISAGAYFAYVRHPFGDEPAWQVARRLVREQAVLTLPGEMFGPGQEACLRLAFANLSADAFPGLVARLIESQGERT